MTSTESDGVRLEREGDLAVVTLARPERRNAQTPATWRRLAAVGAEVLDGDVRVVILRAEGVSFSAGLDHGMLRPGGIEGEPSLADLAALPEDQLDAQIATYQEAFTWWRDERVVSVAAVQGHAVGAGFQLALACDLRILATDAQLSMREPNLGLVPDLGGTRPLVDLVGYPRALEICATERWVRADEARTLRLAELVVPPEDLDAAARDLAAALLAAPAGAVRETKALLRDAVGRDYDVQRQAERTAQGRRLRVMAALMKGS